MRAPRETDLVKQVLQYLQLQGLLAWKNNTGAARYTSALGDRRLVRFGAVGSPDVFAVLPPEGRLLGVECKMPGNKLRATQAAWLDRARAAGALCFVVRSLDELIAALAAEGL